MAVRELVATQTLGLQQAREELGLESIEFELAIELGEVQTVPSAQGGRGVAREELDRLRAETGFPRALRERLRTVGSVEGADLVGITRDRFSKLAKGGLIQPVRWYVNRYRAVVWLYSADEVRWYAAANPATLEGRLPVALRDAIDEGEDHRARCWRERRIEQLRRDAADQWEVAAVWAALLGPDGMADAVPDIYERVYLRKLRPGGLLPGGIGPYATRELIDAVVTADHPDEIEAARFALAHALHRAQRERPAPRPEQQSAKAPAPAMENGPEPEEQPGRERDFNAARGERPTGRWLRLLRRG